MISKELVEKNLDKIRPAIQADGGDVKLIEICDDGVVKVRLTGACSGCPMATLTLKQGVEKILKENIPDIKEVVAG